MEDPSWEQTFSFVGLCKAFALRPRGLAQPFHALKSQKRRDGELFTLGNAYQSETGSVSVQKISRDAEVKKQNFQQCLMKGLETMYRIRQWDKFREEQVPEQKCSGESALDLFMHSKISMYLKCHQDAL